jgi:hypothetical protein
MPFIQTPHPPAPDLLGQTWVSPLGLAQVVDFTTAGMCVVVHTNASQIHRRQLSPAHVRLAIARANAPK